MRAPALGPVNVNIGTALEKSRRVIEAGCWPGSRGIPDFASQQASEAFVYSIRSIYIHAVTARSLLFGGIFLVSPPPLLIAFRAPRSRSIHTGIHRATVRKNKGFMSGSSVTPIKRLACRAINFRYSVEMRLRNNAPLSRMLFVADTFPWTRIPAWAINNLN